MFQRITAPATHRPIANPENSVRQIQARLIQHLKEAGINISEAQEQSFLAELNVDPMERLLQAGILGHDSAQFLNTAFLEALEQGSIRACSLLFLGANSIVQDSKANNILHLILKPHGILKENLIRLLLSLFHYKNAPPMYFLFEKNTKGQTPLDLAEQHTPDFTSSLMACLTVENSSVQKPVWVKTLSNLLLKNSFPRPDTNEVALHFENAAHENEKNALLELARLKIELQEQAPAVSSVAVIEDLLQRASLAGLAEADYLLGKHVYTHDATKRRLAFERACEKNHGKAQLEMAWLLAATIQDNHTRELGFNFAKKAAGQGLVQAEAFAIRTAIELAFHYQLQGRQEASKTALEYAAEKKDVRGQYYLALHYLQNRHYPDATRRGYAYLLDTVKNPRNTSTLESLNIKLRATILLCNEFESSNIPCAEESLIDALASIEESTLATAEIKAQATEFLDWFIKTKPVRATATSRLAENY